MNVFTENSPLNRQRLLSVLALVGFFVLWELICLVAGISDLILPRPSQIAVVLWQKMPLLWPHTIQTLKTTLIGFVLGVLLGIIIGGVIVDKIGYGKLVAVALANKTARIAWALMIDRKSVV